ncbi:MAG: gliding motility-associated protein GldE [Flavobacteriales bacterium]|mgnify:CR=1 FL=1|nr:gliding motility-associated protein GldE [Flavobacteriales bacterium]MBK6549845.1 gliding motility-associated protein GldE [Flavobacteriales bacterium]MBK7102362.1 gliding motility-associated protein GldE [Flavobacteriales bacterium]MBK7113102.1 gliding motility-associated protein GldE [Flavobacteriales bacterium]MBK7482901.1 gliding motility-associated protein GldE [Flavobacteriales bacterium]
MKALEPGTAAVLLAIGVLLVCSAAMSASEVALFSLSPTQLRDVQERGGTSGQRVMDLLAKPRRLLATILIANNFVNVAIIILSTVAVADLVHLDRLPAYMVFAIQVIAVTFLLLLIGEVIPKVYATSQPVRVAQLMSGPLITMRWLFRPISEALVRSTTFIEKRYRKRTGQNISVDSLGHALDLTQDASTSDEEQRILRGIVKFGNFEVRQVMRPRTEMIAFDKEIDFKALLAAIVESGFSRVPIYEETPDRMIGVLYIKDVLPHLDRTEFDWHTLLRDPYFVPESKKLDDLLKEFQSEKVHLAVVVDEYGGTSGIVTLEDVIEEIVGDITDEYDDENLFYSKLDDHTWVFEGKTALPDVYRVMDIDGEVFEAHKGDSGTLGGFVLELTGRIPKKGERVEFRNFTFVVEGSDNKRVRRVKVIQRDEATP